MSRVAEAGNDAHHLWMGQRKLKRRSRQRHAVALTMCLEITDPIDNVPRRDPITEDGMPLTPVGAMGVAIGINFQPTGDGKAAITGDFVLAGEEVNPVIVALRTHGIEVTALHSHMLDEQPRLFFMHFWANDDAIKLAKGLRAALDKTASTKG